MTVIASANCTFSVIICCDFPCFLGLPHLFQSTDTCRNQLLHTYIGPNDPSQLPQSTFLSKHWAASWPTKTSLQRLLHEPSLESSSLFTSITTILPDAKMGAVVLGSQTWVLSLSLCGDIKLSLSLSSSGRVGLWVHSRRLEWGWEWGWAGYWNRQTAMSDGAQTVRGMGVLCVKLTKCRLVGSDEEWVAWVNYKRTEDVCMRGS